MKKVIVKINSIQKPKDYNLNEKAQTIKTQTLANNYEKNGTVYVIYKEIDLADKQETSTMLKIGQDFLALTRSGAVKQQQLFSQGKVDSSSYKTPFGTLKMTVKTHLFEHEISDFSRTIKIAYELYLNDEWQSDNELMITIEPAN